MKKGSKVYVEGQLQTRKWQDQEGRDRFSTEIVVQNWNSALHFLDRRQHQSSDGESNQGTGGGEQIAEAQAADADGESPTTDAPTEEKKEYSDEIPF